MQRLRSALTSAVALFGMVAGIHSAHAQASKNYTDAIRKNPEIGFLAACYNDGLERLLHEVAVTAETEAQYKISLLIQGGIPGLAVYVKQECDSAFRQTPPAVTRNDTIEGMTALFLEFVRVEHQRFMKDCVNAQGSDSEKSALATLCRKAEQSDTRHREALSK